MKIHLSTWLAAGALAIGGAQLTVAPLHGAAASRRSVEARWEQSIVSIEATRMAYNYRLPWTKENRSFIKTGVVIGPREILTAAEDLYDRSLVRVQKSGRGQYWTAEVAWVDYHANLAVLTVADEAFWKGLRPVELLATAPHKEDLNVARWRNANLEIRPVEFSQYFVDDARLSTVPALYLEFDSDMSNIGNSVPVISGGKLAGLTCQQVDNHLRAIPSAFIRAVLAARKTGYRGLGYFPFYWQPTQNTATHQYLKLPGEPRGVVVIFVPVLPEVPENLQPLDIILQVDGFDIDVQGRYKDPDFGQLILENLATRQKFAGDIVRLKIWREGRVQFLNYRLPRFDYQSKLVPDHSFDQEPEYIIAGGLVFQPLIKPFLRSFGAEWQRNAPFRLSYYDKLFPTPERPGVVLLSLVLPDAYNLGYQDLRLLVVEKVNGQPVRHLSDLQQALQRPVKGYHRIEFAQSDAVRKIVLDAAEMEAANARIQERYNIPKIANLAGPKAQSPATGP